MLRNGGQKQLVNFKGLSSDYSKLELVNITKTYPGVKALDSVSLKMEGGSVHALLGENGAGKSTLIKVMTGVVKPDDGEIFLNGEPVVFDNPQKAFSSGINVVHQERNIVPTFTVAENILLERITARSFHLIRKDHIYRDAKEFIDMVGLKVDPYDKVLNLSAAQIQLIEIAKALSSRAKILLLDEPTSSMSLIEANALLETIKRLQKQGVAFLYVTHKLEEVFEIADTVTVLRDGKKVGETLPVKQLNRDSLIPLMVGRAENKEPFPMRNVEKENPILTATNIKSKYSPYNNSFTLNKGEILGWYGLVGAGRTELARALIGYDPVTDGEIFVKGKRAKIRSVSDSLNKWNISYLAESRKEEGLFLSHSIIRNIAASIWHRLVGSNKVFDVRAELELASKYCESLSIKNHSISQIVNTLSGGNQQKVNIAKTLAANPEILIVDEPTVGIDVNTKRQIHELIWELSHQGISIIVISSDMNEVIRLTDRILVFQSGHICGELHNTKNNNYMSTEIMKLCLEDRKLKCIS